MTRRRRALLILDPHDRYGVQLCRRAFYGHGVRAACVLTDPALASFLAPSFPELRPPLFETTVSSSAADLVRTVRELRQQVDIVGVAPFLEFHLELIAAVVDDLGLDWNSAAVLRRCRDKHAMKTHLRTHGVRVPRSVPVRRADDVLGEEGPGFSRFVIKPNDGYSNRAVGFFGPDSTAADIEAHLASAKASFVAEEHIGGDEFSVNGQVDREGRVHPLMLLEAQRQHRNGRDAVYHRQVQLHRSDVRFHPLVAYATEVLEALELRAIPFHMEIKLDDRGPCLIDLGARPIGNGLAFMIDRLHDGAVSALSCAVAHYLGVDGTPPTPNWEAYDRHTFVRIYGCADEPGLVASVSGVQEVEAHPAFIDWERTVQIGDRLVPTLDLDTFPYAVDLLFDADREAAVAEAERLEQQIVWNHPTPTARDRARARAANVTRRARPRLAQLARGVVGRLHDDGAKRG